MYPCNLTKKQLHSAGRCKLFRAKIQQKNLKHSLKEGRVNSMFQTKLFHIKNVNTYALFFSIGFL